MQTEKQIPVVVDKKEGVHIILGKQTEERQINYYIINYQLVHVSYLVLKGVVFINENYDNLSLFMEHKT